MKQIKLTLGQVALVDDEDFEFLNQFKWQAVKKPNTFYAVKNFPNGKGKQISVYMHRIILQLKDSKIHCDHKDGNGLNNQKYNLREATHAQNQRNKKARETGTSRYKGVTLRKSYTKWRATIILNKKYIHIGYFINEIDAAKAYDEKAKELFGEFAWLNFK